MTIVSVIFGIMFTIGVIGFGFSPAGPLRLPRRRTRHQRCLDHIAQLERELGLIDPEDELTELIHIYQLTGRSS